MRIKSLLLLFLSLLLISCSQNKETEWLNAFGKCILIKSEPLLIDSLKLFNPQKMVLKDSKLFILDANNDMFISVSDIKKRKFERFFTKKGHGPNELTDLCQLNDFDDEGINLLDVAKSTVYRYNWNNLSNVQNSYDLRIKNGYAFSAINISGSHFLMSGLFIDNNSQFAIKDCKTDNVHFKYSYPKFESLKDVSSPNKGMALQTQLMINPSKKYAIATYSRTGLIQFYKIVNNDIVLICENRYYDGKFIPHNSNLQGAYTIRLNKVSQVGFGTCNITNSNVYVLYTAKKYGVDLESSMYGRHILVFDWLGKPVNHYLLDCDISCFAIEENKLVCVKIDEGFKASLVKFNL